MVRQYVKRTDYLGLSLYLFAAAPTPATAGAPLAVVRLGSGSTEGSCPE